MSNLTFTKKQIAAERAKMEAAVLAAPVNEEEVNFMVSQLRATPESINKQQTDIKIKKLAENINLSIAAFFRWHTLNAEDSTFSKMISKVSPNIESALSIANDVVISLEKRILNAPNIELQKQLIELLDEKIIEAKAAVMRANAIIAENQELERLKAGSNPVAATQEEARYKK